MQRESRIADQERSLSLALHTQLAIKAFKGENYSEKHPGRVGVYQFAALVKRIWNATKMDNPYADLFLLRIYDSLLKARNNLQSLTKLLAEQASGVEVKLLTSKDPAVFRLSASTPYAFLAGHMVTDLDQVARLAVTLNHMSLLKDQELSNTLSAAQRWVRKALSEPLQWHVLKVTRADIVANNDRAKEALRKFNLPMPEQVLTRTIFPPFRPKMEG